MFTMNKMSFIFLIYSYINMWFFHNSHTYKSSTNRLLLIILKRDWSIPVIGMNFTHWNPAKRVAKIFYSYPENSIICDNMIALFEHFRSPTVRLITPITFPFLVSPWVTKFYYPVLLSFVIDFFNIQNCITMGGN